MPRTPRSYRLVAVAALLVAAVAGTGGVAAATPTDAPADRTAPDVLTDLQQTFQQVDEFLETVADLLRTVNSLTGETGETEAGGE